MRTMRSEMTRWKRATKYKEHPAAREEKPKRKKKRTRPVPVVKKHVREDEDLRYWEEMMGQHQPIFRRRRGSFVQR